LHLIKKTQVVMIKPQPIKSAAMPFGENRNSEWPSPLANGVMATKRLAQKIIPQAQIVMDFRLIIFSPALLPRSPLLPPSAAIEKGVIHHVYGDCTLILYRMIMGRGKPGRNALHGPIHVHVRHGSGEAVFEVENEIELRESYGLKVGELSKAQMLAEQNRVMIIQKWHEFFD
jgi:hypothetical protein